MELLNLMIISMLWEYIAFEAKEQLRYIALKNL